MAPGPVCKSLSRGSQRHPTAACNDSAAAPDQASSPPSSTRSRRAEGCARVPTYDAFGFFGTIHIFRERFRMEHANLFMESGPENSKRFVEKQRPNPPGKLVESGCAVPRGDARVWPLGAPAAPGRAAAGVGRRRWRRQRGGGLSRGCPMRLKRLECRAAAKLVGRDARPRPTAGLHRARSLCRFVALALCTTAHPFHTRSAHIFDASFFLKRQMRPGP